jgi:hypothetical protein
VKRKTDDGQAPQLATTQCFPETVRPGHRVVWSDVVGTPIDRDDRRPKPTLLTPTLWPGAQFVGPS